MERSEAIELISTDELRKDSQPTVWADLGCGSGLFTAALAHLLQEGSTVYAVDKVPVKLDAALFPSQVDIKPLQLDFIETPLPLPLLDGILMANSLHYVQDKKKLLKQLAARMKPGAHFLIVEYDTDKPVPQWVPYPVSFRSLQPLFKKAGFPSMQKLGERASVYGKARMYAALVS